MNSCRYKDNASSWLGDQKKLLTSGAVTTDMFISALHLKYWVLCKVSDMLLGGDN